MSKFIVFGVALALLATGAITVALKLPKPAAAHHVAEPLDPSILHGALQRGRDAMALP